MEIEKFEENKTRCIMCETIIFSGEGHRGDSEHGWIHDDCYGEYVMDSFP